MNAFQSAVRAISSQYQNVQHETQYDLGTFEASVAAPSNEELYHERWEKTPRQRGRQAKDPNAEYIRFDCKDIDDFQTCLSEYLQAPTAPAEHATIEFHFPVTSAFMVYTRDFKRDSSTMWTSADVPDLMRKTAVSVMEVLQPTENAKDQIVRQKAVARTIVEAIQRADGFRYSFHNNWMSREDRAHRFSFFCNDSTLNKGRAANGGVGTEGRAKKKPVYDCKGLIAVKFSITKNNLEVHYRHVPVHKTYEERAPLPRKESKRRRMMEVLDPEAAKRLEKRQKREAQLKEIGPAKKRGRPPKSSKVAGSVPTVSRTGTADESLQPLIDFLGSAERQTPGLGNTTYIDIEDDDGDGGGIMIADDVQVQDSVDDINTESSTPVAFPAQKRKELQTKPSAEAPKPPKGRPKYLGPVIPGTMEGSLDSGNLSWEGPDQPPGSAEARQTEKAKKDKTAKKAGSSGQNKDKDAPSADVADSSLSELELLKKQLAATQERLQKLEADKQNPPAWNYPPYPYPYYPYPPPPPGYYPPPPPNAWPNTPAGSTAQRPHEFQPYQHPIRTSQSNAPPLYPGGPPHPNAPRTAMPPPPLPQTPSQSVDIARDGSVSSANQKSTATTPVVGATTDENVSAVVEGIVTENASHLSSESIRRSVDGQDTSQPKPTNTSQPTVSNSNITSAASQRTSSQPPTTTTPYVQRAPYLQIPPPPPYRRAEPLTGVLKLVDNDSVQRAAHNVSFQVKQNSKTVGPQQGKLKLVSAPSGSTSGPSSSIAEDARMKGFFDSALAAITGPQSASALPVVMYSPNKRKKASQSAPASAVESQLSYPPPYGYPPYPYPPPGSYPYPPLQQPYSPPQQPSYTFVQPPVPVQFPPKPGEQPPPGYEALRAQMVAHAQTVPSPPLEAAHTIAESAKSGQAATADVASTSYAKVGGTIPTEEVAAVDTSSPVGSVVPASEAVIANARAISPQSISSDDSG